MSQDPGFTTIDPIVAMNAACLAVTNEGVGEVELRWNYEDSDGDHYLVISVRKEVQPIRVIQKGQDE